VEVAPAGKAGFLREEVMERYIEQHLEAYLAGTLEGERKAGFEQRLAAADEHTRAMVSQFAAQGATLRETFGGAGAVEPAGGFYARVMQRVESQRVTAWWADFLEPQFTRRLVMASLALLMVLGITMVSTEPEAAEFASSTLMEMMAEPSSELADVNAEAAQPEGRDIILVELATHGE
jgi:hypothetical protein